MDDRTVGLVLRALRRRRGWRQVDIAARAGCSQATVSNVERGHLQETTVSTVRALLAAMDARLQLAPTWRGAELDRLIDADHAAIVARLASRLERAGWDVAVEVTYAIGGERGSIDVLGLRPNVRAALVCEVKSDLPSSEAAGRKLDEKRRLAASIVRSRFGWTPASVGAALVLPESARLRRLLGGAALGLARMFPVDSRGVSGWLREPTGPLAATWFLSDISARNASRVQRPRGGPVGVGVTPAPHVPSGDSPWDLPPRRILC